MGQPACQGRRLQPPAEDGSPRRDRVSAATRKHPGATRQRRNKEHRGDASAPVPHGDSAKTTGPRPAGQDQRAGPAPEPIRQDHGNRNAVVQSPPPAAPRSPRARVGHPGHRRQAAHRRPRRPRAGSRGAAPPLANREPRAASSEPRAMSREPKSASLLFLYEPPGLARQLLTGFILINESLTCSYALLRRDAKRLISNALVTHVTEMTPSDFFSSLKSIITMSPTRGAYGPRMRTTRKVRSWLLIVRTPDDEHCSSSEPSRHPSYAASPASAGSAS
jgi:hypothetical protein